MMQPTHIARPELVTAIAIHNCQATATGYLLKLADGTDVNMPPNAFERFGAPKYGDYLIKGDGFKYTMTQSVFEHRFMNLADLPTAPGDGHRLMDEEISAAIIGAGLTPVSSCCDVKLKFCSADQWKGDLRAFVRAIERLCRRPS